MKKGDIFWLFLEGATVNMVGKSSEVTVFLYNKSPMSAVSSRPQQIEVLALEYLCDQFGGPVFGGAFGARLWVAGELCHIRIGDGLMDCVYADKDRDRLLSRIVEAKLAGMTIITRYALQELLE